MVNQGKNISIGIFVLVAIALVIWGILFLRPSVGDGKQVLHVRFTDIDKIGVGTRVMFAGRPIGEVTSITEVFDAREMTDETYGEVFFYDLTLNIDSRVQVFSTDVITQHTSGLLGERSILIVPQPTKNLSEKVLVGKGDTLYASSERSMEKALQQVGSLTHKATKAMDGILDIIQNNRADINQSFSNLNEATQNIVDTTRRIQSTQLIENYALSSLKLNSSLDKVNRFLVRIEEKGILENLGDSMQNINAITEAINKPQALSASIENIYALSTQFVELGQRMNGSWDQLMNTMQSLSSVGESFKGVAKNSDMITKQIVDGKGTIGHLLMDDTLYLRGMSVMSRIETLMNDINHYGLLFQNNKSWQRQRIKRINTLANLSHPQDFKEFFNEEMSQVNASLARVSILLGKVETLGSQEKTMLNDNSTFIKAFNDLLRQVKGIEGHLTLFNEQLMEANQP